MFFGLLCFFFFPYFYIVEYDFCQITEERNIYVADKRYKSGQRIIGKQESKKQYPAPLSFSQFSKAKNIFFIYIGIFIVSILLSLFKINLLSIEEKSRDAEFSKNMEKAMVAYDSNNYVQAIISFSEANKYLPNEIKDNEEVLSKNYLETSLSKFYIQCEQLISDDKLYNVRMLLDSIPHSVVEAKPTIEKVQTLLDNKLDEKVNEYFFIISKNKGHLDKESIEYLDTLLLVNPSHYWLKFIKEKEQ